MENTKEMRIGEKRLTPYRTGRFYSVADEWYFSVRETTDQGPYASKLIAEKQLKIYISDQEHFSEKQSFRLSLV